MGATPEIAYYLDRWMSKETGRMIYRARIYRNGHLFDANQLESPAEIGEWVSTCYPSAKPVN